MTLDLAEDDHVNPTQRGPVRLNLKFGAHQLAQTITVIAYRPIIRHRDRNRSQPATATATASSTAPTDDDYDMQTSIGSFAATTTAAESFKESSASILHWINRICQPATPSVGLTRKTKGTALFVNSGNPTIP